MSLRRHALAGLALGLGIALLAPRAHAADLGVGDPAPPLAVSKWVKGEPVEGFAPEEVYVVEFWATWCGPCRVSIPHLTELQKQYAEKGVKVIGVSISESDQSEVEPFVKEMGDKMDYAVALDDEPDGPGSGKMSKTWMDAAGEQGIPTAFVVQGGKIAWIGHPMSMDKPLATIVAGEFDAEAAAAERRDARRAQEKLAEIAPKIRNAMQNNDTDEALKIIEGAIDDVPALTGQLGMVRYALLRELGREDEARKAAEQMVDALDDPQALNELAWNQIDPEQVRKPTKDQLALALKAAEKANEAAGGDEPAILDTLALAVFLSGDSTRAIELQQKAVDLAEKDGMPAELLDELKGRLEQFRKGSK